MLLELRISNFILIEDLKLQFGKGLNILTGETGAGKSILIDALSGVLGEKMTTDMIRSGNERAILEGVFDISALPQVQSILNESGIDFDDNIIVQKRELYSSGKGRCFINATQIPVARLKEISEYLVDIHGQNEHQSIIRTARHRELLDNFAGLEPQVKQINDYYNLLNNLQEKIESDKIDEKEKSRRIEYLSFSIKEIEQANLVSGEEENLENESSILANAEKLFEEINTSSGLLRGENGILQNMKKIEKSLIAVSEFDPSVSPYLDNIRQALYSLEDVSGFLRGYESNLDFSPQRINEVEARLSLISNFKKKYGNSIQEIHDYLKKAKDELNAITTGDEEIEKLNAEYKAAVRETKQAAFDLSDKRKKAAAELESKVMAELKDLGMEGIFRISIQRDFSPDGKIEKDNKTYVLYPHGLDRIEFMISVNQGEDLKQLRKVASGGEMSRIMLALKKVILSADIVDTLIFDEVDAGIGGKTAEIVGRKLKTLSKDRQVLVITHLAQIASMSDNHYTVAKEKNKDRITTQVKNLSKKEKIHEIARMLAGEKITEISLKHAQELVAIAEQS